MGSLVQKMEDRVKNLIYVLIMAAPTLVQANEKWSCEKNGKEVAVVTRIPTTKGTTDLVEDKGLNLSGGSLNDPDFCVQALDEKFDDKQIIGFTTVLERESSIVVYCIGPGGASR